MRYRFIKESTDQTIFLSAYCLDDLSPSVYLLGGRLKSMIFAVCERKERRKDSKVNYWPREFRFLSFRNFLTTTAS